MALISDSFLPTNLNGSVIGCCGVKGLALIVTVLGEEVSDSCLSTIVSSGVVVNISRAIGPFAYMSGVNSTV